MRRFALFLFALLVIAAPAGAADDCFDKSGEEAIAACTKRIGSGQVRGGDLAISYNNRAIEYRQLNEYDKAIADYNQAIRIDANFTGAYTGRGLAYEGKGEIAKAKADYRKALTVPPKLNDGQWAHEIARERLTALGEKPKP